MYNPSDDNTLAISVQNASKVYPLSTGSQVSLRHQSGQLISKFLKVGSTEADRPKKFHALQDISFDVVRGESLGIIGRNGAGKTTLLRLLANITRPTTGKVTVNGRFTALIGLGGGFHQDLTGRQNIYLNGAINGVGPQEMYTIIEDIIEFADIGTFIDAPVREYSNGMRARLGFSVAVKLLPEIIFIDEILSVGDEAFKKKSQEYMFDMLSQNKTIVFVSHALNQVRELCERVIWLEDGQIKLDGPSKEVIDEYIISVNKDKVKA